MKIDLFEMERYQSRYWHEVDYDLSESGVLPMTIRELLGPAADAEAFVAGTYARLPALRGVARDAGQHRRLVPGRRRRARHRRSTAARRRTSSRSGRSWSPEDRLAFMVPNYLQGCGLGRHFGRGTDTFRLRMGDDGWALDVDELNDAVGKRTKVVMVCNPNNPTGHVLTADEMDAVVAAADRVGAWIVADEIYRGAELDSDVTPRPRSSAATTRSSSRAACRRRSRCRACDVGWVAASEPR